MRKRFISLALLVIFCFSVSACSFKDESVVSSKSISVSDIPEYSNSAYIKIDNNIPSFKDSEMTTKSFEKYSELDNLGRCSVAYACVGKDIMPAEKRGPLGSVKPSGWHTVKYD